MQMFGWHKLLRFLPLEDDHQDRLLGMRRACKGLAEEGCAHTSHVLPQVKQGMLSAITWLLHWLCVGCYASFLVCHLNLAVPCIYLFIFFSFVHLVLHASIGSVGYLLCFFVP